MPEMYDCANKACALHRTRRVLCDNERKNNQTKENQMKSVCYELSETPKFPRLMVSTDHPSDVSPEIAIVDADGSSVVVGYNGPQQPRNRPVGTRMAALGVLWGKYNDVFRTPFDLATRLVAGDLV